MYMTSNVLYMTKEKKVKIDLDLFYILYKKIVVHLYNSLLEKNSERGIKSIKKGSIKVYLKGQVMESMFLIYF